MSSDGSQAYWISPDGHHGVIESRHADNESRLYQFTFDPEPGELVPLFDAGESPYFDALFDDHLFALIGGGLQIGSQLVFIDVSDGEPGEPIPVSPGNLGGGGSTIMYSPLGDVVVWIDVPFTYGSSEMGSLWRAEIIDGVPQPAVELTAENQQVDRWRVNFRSSGRLAWKPALIGDDDTQLPLHWVDAVKGQLGPIHTIEGPTLWRAAWSPDDRWLASTSGVGDEPSTALTTLEGLGLGTSIGLDQPGAGSRAWIGDRLIYATAGTKLWSATVGEDGPGASTPLHPAILGPVHSVDVISRVVGHDAAIIGVVTDDDASQHLRVLRLGEAGPLEALRVDADLRRQTPVHQLVRE